MEGNILGKSFGESDTAKSIIDYTGIMENGRLKPRFQCLEFGAQLHLRFPKYFALVDRAIDEHNNVITHLQGLKIETVKFETFSTVCCVHAYKAIDSLMALSKLASSGLSGDVSTICRKLLEQAITVMYIERDPEKRTEMYTAYSGLSTPYTIEQILKSKHATDELKSSVKKLHDSSLSVRKKAREIFGIPSNGSTPKQFRNSWSGLLLRDMAEDVGLGRDHFYTYGLFSKVTHSGASNIAEYLDFDNFRFRPRHELSGVLGTVLMGMKSYLITLEVFAKSINYDLKSFYQIRDELNEFEGLPELCSDELLFDADIR